MPSYVNEIKAASKLPHARIAKYNSLSLKDLGVSITPNDIKSGWSKRHVGVFLK